MHCNAEPQLRACACVPVSFLLLCLLHLQPSYHCTPRPRPAPTPAPASARAQSRRRPPVEDEDLDLLSIASPTGVLPGQRTDRLRSRRRRSSSSRIRPPTLPSRSPSHNLPPLHASRRTARAALLPTIFASRPFCIAHSLARSRPGPFSLGCSPSRDSSLAPDNADSALSAVAFRSLHS